MELEGERVPIDTDFRLMCDFSVAVNEKDSEKIAETARKFYYAGLPEGADTEAAARGMSRFYAEGLAPKTGAGSAPKKKSRTVFDFAADEVYFYAAFMAEYRIDLNTAALHWFDFCALFRGLSDECRLKQIIGIRAADLREITSKSERQRIKSLKRLYALGGAEQESEAVRLLKEQAMRDKEARENAGTDV